VFVVVRELNEDGGVNVGSIGVESCGMFSQKVMFHDAWRKYCCILSDLDCDRVSFILCLLLKTNGQ